jgi:hypothetical protein
MILVRNVFQLKFGKAKDAAVLVKESESLTKRFGGAPTRYLTDLTGPFYTLVLEITYESLSAMENEQRNVMGGKEWGEWYQKFIPLVESGHREIYTILS